MLILFSVLFYFLEFKIQNHGGGSVIQFIGNNNSLTTVDYPLKFMIMTT